MSVYAKSFIADDPWLVGPVDEESLVRDFASVGLERDELEVEDRDHRRWRLRVERLLGRVDALEVLESYRRWRRPYEAVFALGAQHAFEQFCRIATSLVSTHGSDFPSELSRLGVGSAFSGSGVSSLGDQLHQARGLFEEIATSGWLLASSPNLSDASTLVSRRDLSLGGQRVLAEIADTEVIVDPQQGYMLRTSEGRARAITSVNLQTGVVTLTEGEFFVADDPEVQSLLSSFAGVSRGELFVHEVPAAEVFSLGMAVLDQAVGHAISQSRPHLVIYRGGGLEPTYS